MLRRGLCLGALAVCLPAQSVIPVKAGLISYAGNAYLDGQPVEVSPTHMVMMKTNGVVRTGVDRAEVLLGPCSALWMDENSSLRLVSSRLDDVRLEVLTGSVLAATGEMMKGTKVTLLLRTASAMLDAHGTYRFDTDPPRVKAIAGRIALQSATRQFSIPAGRMLLLDDATEPTRYKPIPDLFERWSNHRAAYLARLSGQQKANAPDPSAPDESATRIRGAGPPGRFPIQTEGLPSPPNSACGVNPW